MSGGKFASLTSNLLVRKGDARPSTVLPIAAFSAFAHRDAEAAPADDHDDSSEPRGVVLAMSPAIAENAAARETPATPPTRDAKPARPRSVAPRPSLPGNKPRRLMVALTPMEHETLGLVAVKKSLTRHQLLRNAVDEYLALLVEEYEGDCRCIQTGSACDDFNRCN